MPLLLESLWLLFFIFMFVLVRLEISRLRFNDGQVRAMKYFGRGWDHLRAHNYLAAVEYFTEMVRSDTPHKDVAYWLRALAWLELGRIEMAELDCQSALAENLYLTGPYVLRARLCAREGQYAPAREYVDYAIRLNPYDPESYLLRANLQDRLGEPQRAEADRDKAAELIRSHR